MAIQNTGGSKRRSGVARPPERFVLGDDIDCAAPWVEVYLWVELPFWLMVDNASITVNYNGCDFPIATHDNYFELHCNGIADSRCTVIYQGPLKKRTQLSDNIRKLLDDNPKLNGLWRKCKTILKIKSRCNEAIFKSDERRPPSHSIYLSELCRAHLPIVNRLVQAYRLATYDYNAFEVAPWDVPIWTIERTGESVRCTLVPYREWDAKPAMYPKQGEPPVPFQLIDSQGLASKISAPAFAGEFDVMDALNLMERGDYSGAVRRITTAIEVAIEDVVRKAVSIAEGSAAAERFLKNTRTSFPSRWAKYEKLAQRTLSPQLHKELTETRKLRHRIVHGGYRIAPNERGRAQQSVDTGRWIYNWIENDPARTRVREGQIAYRSLGRDVLFSIFPTEITPEGVVVSRIPSH